jgi:hypothetical protein
MRTPALLQQIRNLGYTISTHCINGTIELHAVKLDCTEAPQIARCNEGDGPYEEYRAAHSLAQAVGIELNDS